MEMFDPTADQADIATLLQQVAALRKQQYVAPQGQMVSGHYVAPAMSQQLQPLVGGLVADVQEGRAKDKQKDLDMRAQADLAQWLRRRPEAQTVYGAGDQGPTMTTTQPTDTQNAEWASAGLKNPLTKGIANAALTDNIVQAPIRAEKQADKIEIQRNVDRRYDEDRAARLQQSRELAQSRWDMLQERLASAEAQGAATNGIRLQLGQQTAELRRLAIEAGDRRAAAALDAKSGAADAKANAPKPLTATQQKEMATLADMQGKLQTINGNFKDEYAGAMPALKSAVSPYGSLLKPFGYKADDPKNTAITEYWRQYDSIGNFERHELFGSALTKVEQESWKKQALPATATPAQIRASNAARLDIINKSIENRNKLYSGGAVDATGAQSRSAPLTRNRAPVAVGGNPPPMSGIPDPAEARRATVDVEAVAAELARTTDPKARAVLKEQLRREAEYAQQQNTPATAPPASGGWSVKRVD